jgi:hypothetical protein
MPKLRRSTIVPYLLVCLLALCPLALLAGCSGESKSSGIATAAASNLPNRDELRRQLDEVLDYTYENRHLNLREHAAWQIVHGTLAFKRQYKVERDGELVPVIDYLLGGGQMNGWSFEPGIILDEKTGRRGLRSIVEQGSKTGQGHPDQWLGYLSDCDLKPEDTIKVGDSTYTIEDYVHQIEWDVPRNVEKEYSWTLMALTTYRPTNYQWIASDGQQWTIEKLVRIEAEHDLNASACGGTHRLTGLTMALNRHLVQGGTLEGGWKPADQKIQEAIQTAQRYQNPDGSFSSNYFQRPGNSPDLAQKLGTTGHTLEFITLAATNQQFNQPWVERAAGKLCDLFRKTQQVPLECGALYHAANALVLYRERVFGERTFPRSAESEGDVAPPITPTAASQEVN